MTPDQEIKFLGWFMYQERQIVIIQAVIANVSAQIGLGAPPVLNLHQHWIESLGLKALSRSLSFVTFMKQVLNPVSTLPGPCPWNWNFLVYHRVPFQQACTQLSFNHSRWSYRCVWSKYKVSLWWAGTRDRISLTLAVHMKYFQGKQNQMTSQIERNIIEELIMWSFYTAAKLQKKLFWAWNKTWNYIWLYYIESLQHTHH